MGAICGALVGSGFGDLVFVSLQFVVGRLQLGFKLRHSTDSPTQLFFQIGGPHLGNFRSVESLSQLLLNRGKVLQLGVERPARLKLLLLGLPRGLAKTLLQATILRHLLTEFQQLSLSLGHQIRILLAFHLKLGYFLFASLQLLTSFLQLFAERLLNGPVLSGCRELLQLLL